MEENKAKFRMMKKGYDRFAVDDHIERLEFELDAKNQQLQSYMRQVETATEQLSLLKQRYQSLVTEIGVREKAADDIARLALKEANNVIHSAQNNADAILKDALSTARMVLIEISRIAREAHGLKKDMQEQLIALSQTLDAFEVPKFPSFTVIKEEQDEEQDAPK